MNNVSQMGMIFHPCSVNQAVVIAREGRQMEREEKGEEELSFSAMSVIEG